MKLKREAAELRKKNEDLYLVLETLKSQTATSLQVAQEAKAVGDGAINVINTEIRPRVDTTIQSVQSLNERTKGVYRSWNNGLHIEFPDFFYAFQGDSRICTYNYTGQALRCLDL